MYYRAHTTTKMTMAELELSKRLQEHAEVMKYAREVLGVLNSDFHAERRKLAQKAATIREKMQKGQDIMKISTQELQEKQEEIKRSTEVEYRNALPDTPASSQPDITVLKEENKRVREQVREKQRDCQKLKNEKRTLSFHSKHRKLQKKVAFIQFDTNSTDQHVKGFLKRESGDLQSFEFDFTEDSPVYVSDFLWDSI